MFILLLLPLLCSALAPAKKHHLLVLISDGVSYDDLAAMDHFHEAIAPRAAVIKRLIPNYPGSLLSNHYSLLTGLHPESHGITDDKLYDSASLNHFRNGFTFPATAKDHRWVQTETLPETAASQAHRVIWLNWTGCSQLPQLQHHCFVEENNATIVKDIVDDMAQAEQKDLISVNEHEDHADSVFVFDNSIVAEGRRYGPDSMEFKRQIEQLIGDIEETENDIDFLNERDVDNFIFISTHAFVEPRPAPLVINLNAYKSLMSRSIVFNDNGACVSLYSPANDTARLYNTFYRAHPHLQVKWRFNTPVQWRVRKGAFFPTLMLLPDPGWIIALDNEEAVSLATQIKGLSGYHPSDVPGVAGTLIAIGPDFTPGATIEEAHVTDVYNLLTKVMQLMPKPNNGSYDAVKSLLLSELDVAALKELAIKRLKAASATTEKVVEEAVEETTAMDEESPTTTVTPEVIEAKNKTEYESETATDDVEIVTLSVGESVLEATAASLEESPQIKNETDEDTAEDSDDGPFEDESGSGESDDASKEESAEGALEELSIEDSLSHLAVLANIGSAEDGEAMDVGSGESSSMDDLDVSLPVFAKQQLAEPFREPSSDSGSGEQADVSDSGSGEQDDVSDSGSGEQDDVSDSGSGEQADVSDSGLGAQDDVSDSGSGEQDDVSDSGSGEQADVSDSGLGEQADVSDSGSGEQDDAFTGTYINPLRELWSGINKKEIEEVEFGSGEGAGSGQSDTIDEGSGDAGSGVSADLYENLLSLLGDATASAVAAKLNELALEGVDLTEDSLIVPSIPEPIDFLDDGSGADPELEDSNDFCVCKPRDDCVGSFCMQCTFVEELGEAGSGEMLEEGSGEDDSIRIQRDNISIYKKSNISSPKSQGFYPRRPNRPRKPAKPVARKATGGRLGKREHFSLYKDSLPGRTDEHTGWWMVTARHNTWHCSRCHGINWEQTVRKKRAHVRSMDMSCCLASELPATITPMGDGAFDVEVMEGFDEGSGSEIEPKSCDWNCTECGTWFQASDNGVSKRSADTSVEYVLGPCDWSEVLNGEVKQEKTTVDLMNLCPELTISKIELHFDN